MSQSAISIALALVVTPVQNVTVTGEEIGVGAAAPALSFSGPGEVDLFGQRLPTTLQFAGPVRPRLTLTHITLDQQLASMFRPGHGQLPARRDRPRAGLRLDHILRLGGVHHRRVHPAAGGGAVRVGAFLPAPHPGATGGGPVARRSGQPWRHHGHRVHRPGAAGPGELAHRACRPGPPADGAERDRATADQGPGGRYG